MDSFVISHELSYYLHLKTLENFGQAEILSVINLWFIFLASCLLPLASRQCMKGFQRKNSITHLMQHLPVKQRIKPKKSLHQK